MEMDSVIQEEYSKALRDDSSMLANEYQVLCTAEAYDRTLLEKIPKAILDADFGCGNPTPFVKEGDAVLDLGSGSGKICYILSQVVGPTGKVFGVDFTPEMVELARSQQEAFAEVMGFDNMRFNRASITDLRTDLEKVDRLLAKASIDNLEKLITFERRKSEIFNANPLIPDNSIDVIVSNCVINLVSTTDKSEVFREMFRVLRPGGRIAISDNVSNIEVPEHLQSDQQLWAACYAGVFQEQEFYRAIASAGFEGLRIEVRNEDPAKAVEGVVFRSVTVTAIKPPTSTFGTRSAFQMMYRGPWAEVIDERGFRFKKGEVTLISPEFAAKFQAESYQTDLFDLDEPQLLDPNACCSAPAQAGESCCGPASTDVSSCCSAD
ncbi:arsinothricin biosynthesis methyltransferase ArsM [Burkholderia gladioli]|uniref:arsinothricin biosynthesis methyltransferase ArsM n=1 Tax=Burkholderia gladioli TaxID=28095 RepID=UPI001C5D6E4D|nr:arsinothricin biosynthesis methyltransferase ArsM [Burkholderia gladioli]MBW5287222.1 methyltransferase domain-containing protein [Burkholderia gladioli]